MAENHEKKKILFICTHNSARSQMAEGILKKLYGNRYEVYSAGTQPSSVNPLAIKVMKEIGIDISTQHSKNVGEFLERKFDYVVTVCDRAKEGCPFFPGAKHSIHKGFQDPSAVRGTEQEKLIVFRKVRDEIRNWIEESLKKGGPA
ncbi:MAG: arsenate reductase ArsC [Candidatus Aminicenantes bacterium]